MNARKPASTGLYKHRCAAHLLKLPGHCREKSRAGFDPCGALNSRVFACTPFSRNRISCVRWSQEWTLPASSALMEHSSGMNQCVNEERTA